MNKSLLIAGEFFKNVVVDWEDLKTQTFFSFVYNFPAPLHKSQFYEFC